MKKKMIFATTNAGKIKEVRRIMDGLGYEILTTKEAGIDCDVVEDGTTFVENALIKARVIHRLSGELVLADDSGIEIDYLNKEPGVYSARYLGEDTPYEIKNQIILDKLLEAKDAARSARYVCAIAAVFPDGNEETTLATVEGLIANEANGDGGFGYDPIFLVPQYQKTMAQLSAKEKDAISHRGKALEKMKKLLTR